MSTALQPTSAARRVLVTGATDGIGKQTALELARLGHRVIVHGRTPAKIDAVVAEIRADDRIPKSAVVDGVIADFSSLAAVRDLAADVRTRFPDVSVLVNNAAVYTTDRQETADGIELSFAVNHLAPRLLTEELLPLLRDNATAQQSARVVFVASLAHAKYPVGDRLVTAADVADGVDIEWDNLQREREYHSPYRTYGLSKLCNVLCACSFAAKYPVAESGVAFNSLHPGVIDTKLLRDGLPHLIDIAKSRETGAETSVLLAVSSDVEGATGRYYDDCRDTPMNPLVSPANWGRLDAISAGVTRTVLEKQLPRTVLVTGATDGIGKQLCLDLAKRGNHVIVHGRDAGKAESVACEIKAVAPAAAVAGVVVADLSSLRAVEGLASEVASRFPQLTTVVNNAGIYTEQRSVTADGVELSFTVNHLATVLLTDRLLPVLKRNGTAARPTRAVFVSSMAQLSYPGTSVLPKPAPEDVVMQWDNLQGETDFNAFRTYALSKLCNVMTASYFAATNPATDDSRVVFTSVTPGPVQTRLLDQAAPEFKPQAFTVPQGSEAVLRPVLGNVGLVTGAFVNRDGTVGEKSTIACDADACARLVKHSFDVINSVLNQPVS